jgi:hypothetical protein
LAVPREIKADVLIDDNPGYAMDCAEAGMQVGAALPAMCHSTTSTLFFTLEMDPFQEMSRVSSYHLKITSDASAYFFILGLVWNLKPNPLPLPSHFT